MKTRLHLLVSIFLISFTSIFGQNLIDLGVNYMPNYKNTNDPIFHKTRAHHLELAIEEPMTKRLSLYTAIGINWLNLDIKFANLDPGFGYIIFFDSRKISLSVGTRKYFSKNGQYVGFFGGLYANFSKELNAPVNSIHFINTIGLRPEIGYKWLLSNSLIAELGIGMIFSHQLNDVAIPALNFNHQYLLAKIGYRFNKKTK